MKYLMQMATLSSVLIMATLVPLAKANAVQPSTTDLTELCCVTEISARFSDHAILATSRDRTLARLYKTPAYNQVGKEASVALKRC